MASIMETLIGHSEQKNRLLGLIKLNQLPTTLIFHGPDGVGKKTLAKAMLQIFNCDEADLACGKCSNCIRTFEEKNEMIFELKPETKKTISVKQVREVHQYLSLKSPKKARFVIIDPADKLSTQASNALLKVLEEAPPQTYFILITDRIFSLLATIRSRSQSIHFSKLNENELLSAGSFDSVSISWADGRVSLAEQLMEEKNIELLNKSLKFLFSVTCESAQDWKKLAPWFFSSDEDREFSFNIWSQALEKRLYKLGENLDWLPEAPNEISRLFEQIEFLKKDINANVDKQLAVENFYYQFKEKGAF